MSQLAVTVKIDSVVKRDAQALAQKLGLSLSTIVENKLREVVRERRVVFEEDIVPNRETAKLLRQIESDVKHDRNLSPGFASVHELEQYLDSLSHDD